MKKFFFTIILSIVLFLGAIRGKSQVLQIANQPAKEQPEWLFYYLLDELSGVESTKLLSTIDTVRRRARTENDKKLILYADLFETVFLSYQQTPADEERRLLEKKNYFENSPYPELKGSYYFFLGTMYYFRRNFEKSFHYYINSNDIFEAIGYQNIPLIGHYCYNFFRLYYQVGDYPSAVHFAKAQIKSYPAKDQKQLPFAYNNLGVTYLKIGEVEQAQATFREAIDWAKKLDNHVFVGIASGNYGNTLRLQRRYEEALPYLYTDVEINKDTVEDNSAISCVYIANCLLYLDSVSKAAIYLNLALNLNPDWEWSSFAGHYYETKALYYKKTGRYQQASVYQDSLLQLRDSLKLGNDLALFKAVALQFKEEKALNERREKELEESKLRFTRNLIIGFLLFLLVAVTVYLFKQHRKERMRFQYIQQRDEERLQKAEDKLEEYIEAIKEKNKMIAQIQAELPKTSEDEATDPIIKVQGSADKFTDHSLTTENDWQEFKTLFTLVYPEFFASLQSRYPALSQAEVRMLALCKLQISSQEMAAMLGISLQSVRTSRYRLRKKHPGLVHDEDFKGFI